MVILRVAVRDFLYSRHTLLYLCCRVVVQPLSGSQDQSLHSQYPRFLLCLLIQRHEEPKVVGLSVILTSSSVESLLCLLMGAPSGTKTSRSVKHKVARSKNFASRSVEVIVSDATPISTPCRFLDCESWLWAKQH